VNPERDTSPHAVAARSRAHIATRWSYALVLIAATVLAGAWLR
jgi:glycerol uptake facilitator-like aquaporin